MGQEVNQQVAEIERDLGAGKESETTTAVQNMDEKETETMNVGATGQEMMTTVMIMVHTMVARLVVTVGQREGTEDTNSGEAMAHPSSKWVEPVTVGTVTVYSRA